MSRITPLALRIAAAALFLSLVAACGGTPPTASENTLSVTVAGTGTGTVTSAPAGINVGSGDGTGAFDFATGTEVTLTASATAGTFGGWSGACTGMAAICVVELDSDASVTATFTAFSTEEYVLTLNAAGSGTGSVSSDATIALASGEVTTTETFVDGTTVTMSATQDVGSIFAGWSGACSGTGSCVVTVTADTSVTATFVLETDVTEVTFAILQSSDDAEEYTDAANNQNAANFPVGSVDLGSSDLDLTFDTATVSGTVDARGRVVVGLRYDGANVPANAVITNATISFTRVASSGSTVTYQIGGQAADDAGTFVYGDALNRANFDISSRPRTAASVAWAPSTLVDVTIVTDDVSSIVQEIVDRAGWASGNAMVFIVTSDNSTSSNVLRASSFDGASPPVLTVSYVTPAAP